MAKTIHELFELRFALDCVEDILSEINCYRCKQYGEYAGKVWGFRYIDVKSDDDLEQFTEWQRGYFGIRKGEEYLLVLDKTNNLPSLLYVINVSANSVLCCMHELFGLLMEKY